MRTKIFLLALLSLLTGSLTNVTAQSQQKALFGLGAGLDYGGFGIKGEFQPVKSLGIFAGFGYNLADPAYNAGLSFKLAPEKRIVPTLVAMYGYNGALKVKYAFGSTFHKTYYGPSIGAGVELYSPDRKTNWTFELFLPFRSSAFHDQYDEFERDGVDFKTGILPVTITIGYNFSVSSKNNN
jgi:hypothetical protein